MDKERDDVNNESEESNAYEEANDKSTNIKNGDNEVDVDLSKDKIENIQNIKNEYIEQSYEYTSNNQIEENELNEVDNVNKKLVQHEKKDDCEYKNTEESDNPKPNNKKKMMLVTLIISMALSLLFINITVSKYSNLVYPNENIYGEDVGGLNKVELEREINNIIEIINTKTINIDANGIKYTLKTKDIIATYNEDELVQSILNQYKNENLFNKFIKIINPKSQNYELDIEVNKENLQNKLVEISGEVNQKPEEPRVKIEGNNIDYLEGSKGKKLDVDDLMTTIQNSIQEKSIYEKDRNLNAKYIDYNPNVNIQDLKKVNDKISTYSTTYTLGEGRGSNVELAAKKIDDLILMPGDEFSYEDAIGPVTKDNGYAYASVIINGEFVKGIGGGVCQVSSTLYNTQLKAGILPTERRNHSKSVGYVPNGLDATLATGSINYKFKNIYEYPIVINTHTSGGVLTIEFWSNAEALGGVKYKPVGYSNGNVTNTYLYGYDEYGKKVYEKHVDTSIYK